MAPLRNFGHLISNNRETDLRDREIGFVARIMCLPGSCGEIHEGRDRRQARAAIALEKAVMACPVCSLAIMSHSRDGLIG